MIRRRAPSDCERRLSQSIHSTLIFMLFLFVTPRSFADAPAPLTVEQPPKQTVVLTQGISTTIHSERPFGRISITNPEIVDLVLRTDKSAVLIPEHLGRTNIDFLDDRGTVIGSMDIVVTQQSATDRVVVYDHPTLGAYSTYHCGPGACEHFDEIPNKEQALAPGTPGDQGMPGMPGMSPQAPPQAWSSLFSLLNGEGPNGSKQPPAPATPKRTDSLLERAATVEASNSGRSDQILGSLFDFGRRARGPGGLGSILTLLQLGLNRLQCVDFRRLLDRRDLAHHPVERRLV